MPLKFFFTSFAFTWCIKVAQKSKEITYLLFRQTVQHFQDLRLIIPSNSSSIIPVNRLYMYINKVLRPSISVGFRLLRELTTGRWKLSAFSFNFLIASASSFAPFTIVPALCAPTYSRMLLSWSEVGGSSVMSSSNVWRFAFDWAVWSLAWSSVACSVAVADACFRRLWTRTEAARLGLWNRVTTSRDLCY